MPRKPEPLEPWMLDAIELMVRQNFSLRQAAQQLGVEITPQQADNIAGRIRFQDALEEARLEYYTEIGSNPRLTKEAVVGQLFKLAERLAADREDYKSGDTLLKLCKVVGWVGEAEHRDDFWNWDNIRQADLDWLKAQVQKGKQERAKQERQQQQPEASEQTTAKVN